MNIYEHLTIKFSNLGNVQTVLKKFKNCQINIIWSKERLLWLGPHVMNEFKKIINDKKVNLIAEVGENLGLALALIELKVQNISCLLYTSPSPRDATLSRMPSSA